MSKNQLPANLHLAWGKFRGRVMGMDSSLTPATPSQQTRAILELLADEDRSVVSLVLEQLALEPTPELYQSRLQELLVTASGAARVVLLSELERVRLGDPSLTLQASCADLYSLADFESFCWKMALYEDPRATIYEGQAILETWGRRVAAELAPQAGFHEQVAALRTVLAEQELLAGPTSDDHYLPVNGFLDKVLASRQGWGTTLTTIYMLVGQRAGIHVEPLFIPGRILARVSSCYFEPLQQAVSLEHRDLEAELQRVGFKPEVQALETLPYPLLAQMMANNLVSIYTRADDIDRLLRWQTVLSWLQEVDLT